MILILLGGGWMAMMIPNSREGDEWKGNVAVDPLREFLEQHPQLTFSITG